MPFQSILIPPRPQPSVVVFGAISAEAVEAVAAAAAAAVGASVGGSVGASVGGSAGGSAVSGGGGGGGGSGGGGSGSSSPTGDPLSLIFLVQAIAITRNIASMPTTCMDEQKQHLYSPLFPLSHVYSTDNCATLPLHFARYKGLCWLFCNGKFDYMSWEHSLLKLN